MSLQSKHYISDLIIVVSGLPRSGTSMMMRMLGACNIPLLADEIRKPDEDNPNGYFEFERVKDLGSDNSWLEIARGTAVKIVSPLLRYLDLDKGLHYKVIFMLRSIDEILASQKKMANRSGHAGDDSEDGMMKQNYSIHLEEIKKWLEKQKNIDVLYLAYTDAVHDPRATVESILNFLEIRMDAREIAKISDASLYRQRAEMENEQHSSAATEEKEDQAAIMDRLRRLGYL
jgi:hypothetical protein